MKNSLIYLSSCRESENCVPTIVHSVVYDPLWVNFISFMDSNFVGMRYMQRRTYFKVWSELNSQAKEQNPSSLALGVF